MFSLLKKLFSIETKPQGKEIDFDNSWTFEDIKDKNKFLATIIDLVPTDSVWAIEGLFHKEIFDTIEPFIIIDETKVRKGTLWPKQDSFKVLLTTDSKRIILSSMSAWDLETNCIHQHIYSADKFYLTSYDNLHDRCTWLSKDIDRTILHRLQDENVLIITD